MKNQTMISLLFTLFVGNLTEVKMLIEKGAEINSKHFEITPLQAAASDGSQKILMKNLLFKYEK